MATENQKTLIRTIMGERELEIDHINWVEERLDRADNALVQTIITRLKGMPRKGAVVQPALIEDLPERAKVTEAGGIYLLDGDAYKVVRSQIGRLYAKKATPRGWGFDKGAIFRLFEDMRMTGEEIAAHGVANCFCVNCSTELTDPTSKRVGLGTSCGPAILGKEGYKAAKKAVAHFEDVIAFEAAKKAEAKARREEKKAEKAQQKLELASA